ncbi:ATP-grasp domain-containing protein [Clostridium cellulovorans]|uniref:ATP-grasp domain-containing protein n=1 Tax=Clostridium cellulovorans (strain ATCC 35296 / DSM 3052 / OCM 3 / 743B) TaxID=573061 RepID=D9SU80_CLOC7|nr:hypothetical protein [Clostridium cellulovorans]ADL52835.1 hypothetical protein Clocel_3148 [Clostridium cellulovorans 743B]
MLKNQVLICVYYHNRSKKGNLKLLSEWRKKSGVKVMLLANKSEDYVANYVDEVLVSDFENQESLFKNLDEYLKNNFVQLLGAVSFGEDEVPITNRICDIYNLRGNSISSGLITRNKWMMREALYSSDIYAPKCYKIYNLEMAEKIVKEEFLDKNKKAFLKPPIGTGSMFCTKITSIDDLRKTWNEFYLGSWEFALKDPLCNELFGFNVENYYMVIEELLNTYICEDDMLKQLFSVHELSVDGVLNEGQLHVYGITDKLIPDDKDGREYMWRTTKLSREFQEIIKIKAQKITDAFGLKYGCIHYEFRLEKVSVNEADIIYNNVPVRATLLEGASRFGGAYMQTFWYEATGFDSISYLCNQACGIISNEKNIYLNPAIMLNVWSEETGVLEEVVGYDELKNISQKYLADFTIYDNKGDKVEFSSKSERGAGHVMFINRDINLLKDPQKEYNYGFNEIEELFMYAIKNIKLKISK